MSDDKMPCINCITFAVCKAQVDEYLQIIEQTSNHDVVNGLYLAYRELLLNKCELICEWIDTQYNRRGGYNYGDPKYGFIIYQMNEAFRGQYDK